MVLDTSILNTQHYKVRIKGKVEQSRERNTVLPYTRCSSYWKESFRVALGNGRQLYLTIKMVFRLIEIADYVAINSLN